VNWGDGVGGHWLVWMEWRPAGWSVSASVNLPLHHKDQKFSSGTGSPGWFQKKGHKMVMCVCFLMNCEVLVWLSVWSEVQIICTWSSWCHCHPVISCSSKIQNGLPFCYRLTMPLNGCSSSSSSFWWTEVSLSRSWILMDDHRPVQNSCTLRCSNHANHSMDLFFLHHWVLSEGNSCQFSQFQASNQTDLV